jgi:hypothetical protein
MSSAQAPPEGYALALEEARRALEDQERTVVELRTRAGTLIAAAAITTSFFGGPSLAHDEINAAAWAAIAAFVGLGVAMLVIVWPRRDWEFSLAPSEFIATYLEPVEGDVLALPLIHRDLALHMGASADLNRHQLRILMIVFRIGCLLLMIEVLGWVVAIICQS